MSYTLGKKVEPKVDITPTPEYTPVPGRPGIWRHKSGRLVTSLPLTCQMCGGHGKICAMCGGTQKSNAP